MKSVTVRQMIEALEALPEEVKDLPFMACDGGSAECDPTDNLNIYVQPSLVKKEADNPTGRTYVEGPPQYVTLHWDY